MIVLGERGIKFSHQSDFPKNAVCKCGGNARIAFVYCEGFTCDAEVIHVCNLHKNEMDNKWPHDCVSVAVYFCSKCLKPVTYFNQG